MGKKKIKNSFRLQNITLRDTSIVYSDVMSNILFFLNQTPLKINYTNLVFIVYAFTFFKKLILQYKVFEVNQIIIIKYNNKN